MTTEKRNASRPRALTRDEALILVSGHEESQKPALRELRAKSPTFDQDVHEKQVLCVSKLESLKSEIRAIDGFDAYLGRLAKVGAKPEMILHVLAMEVAFRLRWTKELRKNKGDQKKLAIRLRDDARTIEIVSADEDSYPDLGRSIFGQGQSGEIVPPSERVPRSTINELYAYADELENRAQELGRLLKDTTPSLKRQSLVSLLRYVHATTGDVHRQFILLAEMLFAVYERYGIETTSTAGKLEKIFNRHVQPLYFPADKTPR